MLYIDAVPNAIELTAEKDLKGSGFYAQEVLPDGRAFRWTGRQPETTVDVVMKILRNQRIIIGMNVIQVIDQRAADSLAIYWDGVKCTSLEKSWRHGRLRYRGEVTANCEMEQRHQHMLKIVSDTSQPEPNEKADQDSRHLGLAISRITVRPAA